MRSKLLVIDDQPDRKPTYTTAMVGSDFEVLFASTRAELEAFRETPVDGYLVDMFLDRADWGSINAADILRNFVANAPRPAPVFLISKLWGDERVLSILKEAGDSSAKVVQYLAWSEFEQAADTTDAALIRQQALQKKIAFEMSRWHGPRTFRPEPSQRVRILVLADLQYSDPHTDPKATFAESWIATSFKRLKEQPPDLVVIAGDVAFSGTPEQYALAEDRLTKDLMGSLWDENNVDQMRDRLVLVPGNHDVNLRFSACDAYTFNLSNKKLEALSPSTESARLTTTVPPEQGWHPRRHHDYALEPFRRFAYSLTGDSNWTRSHSLCWVDRRFIDCGIRFFGLNSVSQLNADAPDEASFDEPALRAINRSLSGEDASSFFNIAISHHGLRSDSADPRQKQISNWWDKGRDFFALHQISLWIYGHYHEFDTESVNSAPFSSAPLWRVQAPTPRIIPGVTSRGFCVVDLDRKDSRVIDAHATYFALKGGSVEKVETRRVFGKG